MHPIADTNSGLVQRKVSRNHGEQKNTSIAIAASATAFAIFQPSTDKVFSPNEKFLHWNGRTKTREFAASEGRLRVLVANNAIRDCGWVEI